MAALRVGEDTTIETQTGRPVRHADHCRGRLGTGFPVLLDGELYRRPQAMTITQAEANILARSLKSHKENIRGVQGSIPAATILLLELIIDALEDGEPILISTKDP
jgi:hypothetical protein